MASFRRIKKLKDINLLISNLRPEYPNGNHAKQLIHEVQANKLDANIFTDQWPHFTTIVLQEFSPRLSQVADLRIFSSAVDTVTPILEEAKLLDNIGSWQAIHYMMDAEHCEEFESCLIHFLKRHKTTKEKEISLIFDYPAYSFIEDPKKVPDLKLNLPGLFVKKIPSDTAKYIADHWLPGSMEYPLKQKIKYLEDILDRFGMVGIYSMSDPKYPVAWCGLKPGGMLGFGYTLTAYRNLKLYSILIADTLQKMMMKGIRCYGETHEEGVLDKRHKYAYDECIGRSKIICIYS